MPPSHQSKILSFYKKNRRMPSYGEIMALCGYRSKNAAHWLVKKMIKADLVEKDASGRIVSKQLWGPIAVLGTVEAGWPSPAEEELVDTMSLDEYLIRNKEASFIMKVKGNSMKEAGIFPGDMVIVERGREPKDGDIVIAEVDREWTMKYFRKRGGKIYLDPANKEYTKIVPKEELKVAAVVRAVIRRY
jgi:SOS regulatory protein LexA